MASGNEGGVMVTVCYILPTETCSMDIGEITKSTVLEHTTGRMERLISVGIKAMLEWSHYDGPRTVAEHIFSTCKVLRKNKSHWFVQPAL